MRRAIGLAATTMGAAAILPAAPAVAAPWILTGTATARAGVDSNPYLQTNASGLTGTGGLLVAANATRTAAKSTTTLIGSADVSQSFSHYGRNTNFLAGATRSQTITEHLVATGQVTYTSSLSPQNNFGFDASQASPAALDYLTIGTRTQRVDGSLSVDWQATSKDTFRIGGFGSHSSTSSRLASSSDQIGANFNYLRTLNARTSVGVQLQASRISSGFYPSASSYQASLQLVRQITPNLVFDGSVGIVKQHSAGFGAVDRITPGFSGSLCATYPRLTGCLTFSRQAAPSGIGGLRTDTQIGLNGIYRLTEHSRVEVGAVIDDSTSRDVVAVPRQRYYSLTTSYRRDVSQRIAVGATGRFQRRDTEGSVLFPGSSPSGYSLTADVSYAFGRIGR